MKEKIEISLSRNKIIGLTIGSLLFVIACIWLFLYADNFKDMPIPFLKNPLVIKGFGILGILFFGATGISGFRKIFDKKVGLIIDSNGITDNSNASSIGLIEWDDISDVITKQVMSTKFL